ncbi:unnamed protein product [Trichogramma brassicae]|uniref:Retrotransposon gag domain-containing protein n=1 Tax=Trichogramma brassicae TaxID=86971 RepID=A0A6H5IYP0_9HYME|nr:unnamed protein product [Trichogramma brassicae]
MFGALIRHGEKDLVSRPDIVGDLARQIKAIVEKMEPRQVIAILDARRLARTGTEMALRSRLFRSEIRAIHPEALPPWFPAEDEVLGVSPLDTLQYQLLIPQCQQPLRMEQPTGSDPEDSGNSEEEEGAGAMVDAKAEMPPSSIPCVVSSSTPTTTSSPAIYTAPPTQSTPSTTPRVVSTWSSSTTTSSAPLTMGPSMGLTQALAGLSFNERDSVWPPTRPLAATSLGAVGPSPSRYDIPSLGAGTKTWPSNARQTPWGTRPKEVGHTRSGHQDGSREKIEDEEHERRDRPGARRPERADEDRANRRRTRERSDDREPEPETDDDEESNRRRVGFQRIGRSSLDRSNPRNDRDASYERQERSPYRASSPPTRMTGLQATKVLQSWHLSFDGENREEARNFLENVRDCKESNEIPTDKLLKAMPAILKGKAQRWAFEDRYMKVLRDTTIRRDIDHRTQAKGEKIADYADCFLQLVRHLKQRPRDEELVEMFLQNVRNGYRRFIAPHRPWTIAEAVELVKNTTNESSRTRKSSKSHPPATSSASRRPGFPQGKVGKIAAMTEIDDFSENEESDKADNSTPKTGRSPMGPVRRRAARRHRRKRPSRTSKVRAQQGRWGSTVDMPKVCTGATSAGKRIGGTAGGPATVPDVTTEAREASEGESDEEDLLEHVIWVPEENDEAAEDMAWESGSAEKEDQTQETDRSKKGAKEFSRQQTSQLIAVNVGEKGRRKRCQCCPNGRKQPRDPRRSRECVKKIATMPSSL